MKLRASILDRIEKAFAEAVASGDYEAAEGWLTMARHVSQREDHQRRAPRVRLRSSR